jgi:hypothetical protein
VLKIKESYRKKNGYMKPKMGKIKARLTTDETVNLIIWFLMILLSLKIDLPGLMKY